MVEGIWGPSCLYPLSINPAMFSHIPQTMPSKGLVLCRINLLFAGYPSSHTFSTSYCNLVYSLVPPRQGSKPRQEGHQEGEKQFPGGRVWGQHAFYCQGPGMIKHNERSFPPRTGAWQQWPRPRGESENWWDAQKSNLKKQWKLTGKKESGESRKEIQKTKNSSE